SGLPVYRRPGGGRALLAGEGRLGLYLALPRPDAILDSPIPTDRVINRHVRGLLAGLVRAAAPTGSRATPPAPRERRPPSRRAPRRKRPCSPEAARGADAASPAPPGRNPAPAAPVRAGGPPDAPAPAPHSRRSGWRPARRSARSRG